ncbi:MAG: hypothetical protein QF830_01325 [Rhodospirillales bacterium]|nr:hypothetical protein [Rhodospirillales bacterium]MDP6882752.1 hypothetical protein [Rhodospirillales bacterium]
MRASALSFIVVMALLASAGPAHAYLDPFTGSAILQLTLGAIAGLLVTAKLYWIKIKQLYMRLSGKLPEIDTNQRPE